MDLRKARQKRDWTLEKVAELIGPTPMSVSRHETGQSFPRPDLIEKYLAIYHGYVTEEEVRATYRKAQKARAAQAPPHGDTAQGPKQPCRRPNSQGRPAGEESVRTYRSRSGVVT